MNIKKQSILQVYLSQPILWLIFVMLETKTKKVVSEKDHTLAYLYNQKKKGKYMAINK